MLLVWADGKVNVFGWPWSFLCSQRTCSFCQLLFEYARQRRAIVRVIHREGQFFGHRLPIRNASLNTPFLLENFGWPCLFLTVRISEASSENPVSFRKREIFVLHTEWKMEMIIHAFLVSHLILWLTLSRNEIFCPSFTFVGFLFWLSLCTMLRISLEISFFERGESVGVSWFNGNGGLGGNDFWRGNIPHTAPSHTWSFWAEGNYRACQKIHQTVPCSSQVKCIKIHTLDLLQPKVLLLYMKNCLRLHYKV